MVKKFAWGGVNLTLRQLEEVDPIAALDVLDRDAFFQKYAKANRQSSTTWIGLGYIFAFGSALLPYLDWVNSPSTTMNVLGTIAFGLVVLSMVAIGFRDNALGEAARELSWKLYLSEHQMEHYKAQTEELIKRHYPST